MILYKKVERERERDKEREITTGEDEERNGGDEVDGDNVDMADGWEDGGDGHDGDSERTASGRIRKRNSIGSDCRKSPVLET